jgi:hypothetical protein
MQCQSSRGQCKWLLLCLSAKRCPTQGLTRSGPTGASGTDTQCFVAVDRGSITESIKWLAHVAVTENGIREDESRGVAAFARVLVAHRDKVSTLSALEGRGCCGSESRENSDGDGCGEHCCFTVGLKRLKDVLDR